MTAALFCRCRLIQPHSIRMAISKQNVYLILYIPILGSDALIVLFLTCSLITPALSKILRNRRCFKPFLICSSRLPVKLPSKIKIQNGPLNRSMIRSSPIEDIEPVSSTQTGRVQQPDRLRNPSSKLPNGVQILDLAEQEKGSRTGQESQERSMFSTRPAIGSGVIGMAGRQRHQRVLNHGFYWE